MIDDRLATTALSPGDKALIKLAYRIAVSSLPLAAVSWRAAVAEELILDFEERAEADFEAVVRATAKPTHR